MTHIQIIVSNALHKAFKAYCAMKGVTMSDELREAMIERIAQAEKNEVVYDIKSPEQCLRDKSDA